MFCGQHEIENYVTSAGVKKCHKETDQRRFEFYFFAKFGKKRATNWNKERKTEKKWAERFDFVWKSTWIRVSKPNGREIIYEINRLHRRYTLGAHIEHGKKMKYGLTLAIKAEAKLELCTTDCIGIISHIHQVYVLDTLHYYYEFIYFVPLNSLHLLLLLSVYSSMETLTNRCIVPPLFDYFVENFDFIKHTLQF